MTMMQRSCGGALANLRKCERARAPKKVAGTQRARSFSTKNVRPTIPSQHTWRGVGKCVCAYEIRREKKQVCCGCVAAVIRLRSCASVTPPSPERPGSGRHHADDSTADVFAVRPLGDPGTTGCANDAMLHCGR